MFAISKLPHCVVARGTAGNLVIHAIKQYHKFYLIITSDKLPAHSVLAHVIAGKTASLYDHTHALIAIQECTALITYGDNVVCGS